MNMNYRPLILICPFVLILALLLCIDTPLESAELRGTAGNTVTSAEIATEPSASIMQEGNSEQAQPDDVDTHHLILVVGKTGSMKGGGEPVYKEPDETSAQVAELQYHCAVMAEAEQLEPDWIYVNLMGKGSGYVNRDAVELCPITVESDYSIRNEIMHNALSYLGLRFVRYGDSLTNGIDCSHFVSRIYALSGLEVPDQPLELRDFGTQIDESEAQIGDLVFYDKANDGSGHVGLYLGDGFIINSSGHSGKKYPEGGVRICRLLYADRDSYQIYNILEPAEVAK